jgi:hypothetical protein
MQPASLVWDLGGGHIVGELKGHKYGLSCLAFSPKAPSTGGPPLLVRPLQPITSTTTALRVNHLLSGDCFYVYVVV